MADKIKDWIEQLVTIPRVFKHTKGRGFELQDLDDVSFVYCQPEARVIGKRNRHVEGGRPGLQGRLGGAGNSTSTKNSNFTTSGITRPDTARDIAAKSGRGIIHAPAEAPTAS